MQVSVLTFRLHGTGPKVLDCPRGLLLNLHRKYAKYSHIIVSFSNLKSSGKTVRFTCVLKY
jgi:hypothetical protein